MKVTDITRSALAFRRQAREMTAKGYLHKKEVDWKLIRGGLWDHMITDVKIDTSGKGIYYKIEREER